MGDIPGPPLGRGSRAGGPRPQRLFDRSDIPDLRFCPAVTLADQEKALERVGHSWHLGILVSW
eukprot:864180-Lingulodinium_polyedra.AAC.1